MDEPIAEREITPAVSENSKHAYWMKEALLMVSYLLSFFLTRFGALTATLRVRKPWNMERLQWDVSWSMRTRSWDGA